MSRVSKLRRVWNAVLTDFFGFPLSLSKLALLALLWFGVGFLLLGRWQDTAGVQSQSPEVYLPLLSQNVERRLQTLSQLTEQAIGLMEQDETDQAFELLNSPTAKEIAKKHDAALILRNDTLRFWTFTFGRNLADKCLSADTIIWSEGIWYYKRLDELPPYRRIHLVALRYEYPIRNRFLQSGFLPSLSFFEGKPLPELAESIPSLAISSRYYQPKQGNTLSFLGFLALLLAFLLTPLALKSRRPLLLCALASMVAVFWRLYGLNSSLYTDALGKLFSPELFASSYLMPSIGDLFLHALTLLGLVFIADHAIKAIKHSEKKRNLSLLAVLSGVVAIALLQWGDSILRVLIINSTLSFPPYDLSSISIYVVIAYISLALWFSAATLLLLRFCQIIVEERRKRLLLLAFLFAILHAFYLRALLHLPVPPAAGLATLATLALYLPLRFKKGEEPFRGAELIVAIIIALHISLVGDWVNTEKDLMTRRQVAERIGKEQDPLLEIMLPRVSRQLQNDTVLATLVDRPFSAQARVSDYVSEHYMVDYLSAYEFNVTLCGENDRILLADMDSLSDCATFFGHTIATRGTPVPSSNFYFLKTQNGRINYLGLFPFKGKDGDRFLYLELESKAPNTFWGYPELLINEHTNQNKLPEHLSTALYQHRQLLTKSGPFAYPLKLSAAARSGSLFKEDGYSHLAVQQPQSDIIVLVSKQSNSPFNTIGAVMFVTLLFGAAFAIIIRAADITPLKPIIGKGIVGRLQIYTAAILLANLLISLGITIFTLKQTLTSKDRNIRHEKSLMVVEELKKLNADIEGASLKKNNELNRSLTELADRVFCDINLYDTCGWIIASSRIEIFTNSLQGEKINPKAWHAIKQQHKPQFVTTERIGELEFESFYIPYAPRGRTEAYVNLPLFTRPDEFRGQFLSLTSLMLDFFAMLAALMLLFSFFLANRVLAPLARLKKSMETISITQKNEPLFYDMPDQVGSLIQTYNLMLHQLEKSTAELAENERQTAWRNMARQIAHDIKNPLTPIKLSLQRVVKLKREDDPKWEARFDEFAAMMDDQITILANTADTFSTFSKLAEGKAQAVNPIIIVKQSLELFSSVQGVKWSVQMPKHITPQVRIDPTNLQRIMNNLIANAVQACSQQPEPAVAVRCQCNGRWFDIAVRDNGPGISLEAQEIVFRVQFTTKSKGSGLGLSIVKAAANAAGGEATFYSCPHPTQGGALFLIRLPRIDYEKDNM